VQSEVEEDGSAVKERCEQGAFAAIRSFYLRLDVKTRQVNATRPPNSLLILLYGSSEVSLFG
jgi:hypothetical protein